MTKAQKKYALGKQLKELGFRYEENNGDDYWCKDYKGGTTIDIYAADGSLGELTTVISEQRMSIGSIALLDSILKNPGGEQV